MRFHYECEFALQSHEPIDAVLIEIRHKTARAIAQKIVEQPKFFDLTIRDRYGSLQTDCVVFTEKEYADKLRKTFQEGVKHAQGFTQS